MGILLGRSPFVEEPVIYEHVTNFHKKYIASAFTYYHILCLLSFGSRNRFLIQLGDHLDVLVVFLFGGE